MKAAVITFPGSNCDDDCVHALNKAGFATDMIFHKETPALGEYQLVLLPGGFSYGDYLRCGAIAGLSPSMAKVREFADQGGAVIGICNGFQILCDVGMLPGALAKNDSLNFVCRDITLKTVNNKSPWTCALAEGERLVIPIAHGDGRYVIDDNDYETMRSGGQILFTYVDAKGNETPEANPNGSRYNIAGVSNAKKNVFGMMPHPDRATDLRSRDGMKFWSSIVKSLSEKHS